MRAQPVCTLNLGWSPADAAVQWSGHLQRLPEHQLPVRARPRQPGRHRPRRRLLHRLDEPRLGDAGLPTSCGPWTSATAPRTPTSRSARESRPDPSPTPPGPTMPATPGAPAWRRTAPWTVSASGGHNGPQASTRRSPQQRLRCPHVARPAPRHRLAALVLVEVLPRRRQRRQGAGRDQLENGGTTWQRVTMSYPTTVHEDRRRLRPCRPDRSTSPASTRPGRSRRPTWEPGPTRPSACGSGSPPITPSPASSGGSTTSRSRTCRPRAHAARA